MTEPNYLSNQELVDELKSLYLMPLIPPGRERDKRDARFNSLRDEVLYRLNEPWRKITKM